LIAAKNWSWTQNKDKAGMLRRGQGWYVEELYLAKIGKYVYNGLFKIEEIIIQNYVS
jgi:hypothetical protein